MKKNVLVILLCSLLFATACATRQVQEDNRLRPPLCFLLVGDSMMGGNFGRMLQRRLGEMPGVKAYRITKLSTGLSELNPYDWTGKTVFNIKNLKADILVASFGANDCLAVRNKEGMLFYFGSPLWEKEYAAHIHDYLKAVTPLVKRVYMVGQPSTDHPSLAPRYPVANRLFQAACAHYANATYIPAWDWTSVDGKFVPYMKNKQGVTGMVKFSFDPIHHTAFGGSVLAELFIDYIRKDCLLEEPAP